MSTSGRTERCRRIHRFALNGRLIDQEIFPERREADPFRSDGAAKRRSSIIERARGCRRKIEQGDTRVGGEAAERKNFGHEFIVRAKGDQKANGQQSGAGVENVIRLLPRQQQIAKRSRAGKQIDRDDANRFDLSIRAKVDGRERGATFIVEQGKTDSSGIVRAGIDGLAEDVDGFACRSFCRESRRRNRAGRRDCAPVRSSRRMGAADDR